MTTSNLIETLAALKNVHASQIKNLDLNVNTFEVGKSVYSFDLTKSGKYVKVGSVKFFATIESISNHSN